MQFCSPHIYASGTTTMRSTWPEITRSEAESMIYNRQHRLLITDRKRSPNSFSFIYNEENKLFSFSQENGTKLGTQAVPKASFYQSPPNSIASSESGRGNNNMSSSGMTQSIDLGCALYLLSSPPTSQTSAIGLSQLVQSSVSHPIQSLDSGQQLTGVAQYSCSQGVRDKSASLVFVPDANETNMYCNDMFQGALDALLENEASWTLWISWEYSAHQVILLGNVLQSSATIIYWGAGQWKKCPPASICGVLLISFSHRVSMHCLRYMYWNADYSPSILLFVNLYYYAC